jgi:hypothetical protein
MRSSRRVAILLALAALLGCRAETYGADDRPTLLDQPVTTLPRHQFAGAVVVVASPALRWVYGESLVLRFGGIELHGLRSSDTSFRFSLPDSMRAGLVEIRAEIDGGWLPVGEVEVAGYRGITPINGIGSEWGDLVPFPRQAPTGVLFSASDSLYFISTSGYWRKVAGARSGTSFWAVGQSYREGHIVVRDTGSMRTIARFDPITGSLTEVGPTFSALSSNGSTYELAPGKFLFLADDRSYIVPGSVNWTTGSPHGLVFDPTGGYAIPLSWANPGTHILNASNGVIHGVLAGDYRTTGVAFTDTGTTVYVSSSTPQGAKLRRLDYKNLVVHDSVVDSAAFGDGGWDLALDRGERWLFELVHELAPGGGAWSVIIRDPITLERIARLTAPWGLQVCPNQFLRQGAIISDPGGRSLSVLVGGCGVPGILRFDLLPP